MMFFISFFLNCYLFFMLFNLSYFRQRKEDPYYPEKPLSKLLFVPTFIAIVFTLLLDVMKGMMIYNVLLFVIIAAVIYLIFYVFGGKK